MMQGQLIKRTHVPKPAVDADGWGAVNAADAPNGSSVLLKSDEPPVMEMYAPEDFVVGGEVNLFGTVFYIYDCDDFTKDYNKHLYIESTLRRSAMPRWRTLAANPSSPPHVRLQRDLG